MAGNLRENNSGMPDISGLYHECIFIIVKVYTVYTCIQKGQYVVAIKITKS